MLLPDEIVLQILMMRVDQLVRDRNYSLAAYNLFSKALIARFYTIYFGTPDASHFILRARIIQCFKLCKDLYHTMDYLPRNMCDSENFALLNMQRSYIPDPPKPFNSWEFNYVNFMIIPKPDVLGIHDFRAVITGANLIDIHWIGPQKGDTAFYRNPVILISPVNLVYPKGEKRPIVKPNYSFGALSKLFKRSFGNDAGLFMTTGRDKNDNVQVVEI